MRALIFLLDTFSRLYLLLLILRFWLPFLRANYRNPVTQGVLRYTSPLVTPIRRYVPSIGKLDTATVLSAFVIQFAVLVVIVMLAELAREAGALTATIDYPALAFQACVELAMLSVLLFIVAIILRVVFSLIGRHFGPISDILADLSEPLLRPVRSFIPPLGVVDISAYIVIVLLIALNMILADLITVIR